MCGGAWAGVDILATWNAGQRKGAVRTGFAGEGRLQPWTQSLVLGYRHHICAYSIFKCIRLLILTVRTAED